MIFLVFIKLRDISIKQFIEVIQNLIKQSFENTLLFNIFIWLKMIKNSNALYISFLLNDFPQTDLPSKTSG